jgi:hypothetical protein
MCLDLDVDADMDVDPLSVCHNHRLLRPCKNLFE